MVTITQKREISANLRQAISELVATLTQIGTDDYLNRGSLKIAEHCIDQAKNIADGKLKVD